MQEVVIVRVGCALLSTLFLAFACVLTAVSLVAPWWTPGPTALEVPLGADEDEMNEILAQRSLADGLSSEITLWAHVGCAGNETWTDICSIEAEDCAALLAGIEEQEADDPSWIPVETAVTTTPIPTLDPGRSTTPEPPMPNWACGAGRNCEKPSTTIYDAERRWGKAAEELGEGQSYGDSIARLNDEGTVTAEKPPDSRVTERVTTSTTVVLATRQPIGKKPGEDDPIEVPEADRPHSLWDSIFDNYFPDGDEIDMGSPATEYDPRASPSGSGPTTAGPDNFAGAGEVAGYCLLTRDGTRSRIFVCRLKSHCGTMGQARGSVIGAMAFALLSGLAMLRFGGGGGGYSKPTPKYPKGKPEPTKHTAAFFAAGAALLEVLLLILGIALASGVDVSHSMDGPGTVCAGLAVMFGLLGAMCALFTAKLTIKFPGRKRTENEKKIADTQVDPEDLRQMAEQEFVGLKDRHERSMPVRVAWMPPMALEAPEPELGLAPGLDIPRADPDDASSEAPSNSHLAGGESSMVLAMPPQTLREASPTSPVQEKSLQRFYQGEGAVYAHRFFGATSGEPFSPSSTCSTAMSSARQASALPSGWEMSTSEEGEVYYFNRATGESSWEAPPSLPGSPTEPLSREEALRAMEAMAALPGSPTGSPMAARGFEYKTKRSKKTGQVYSIRVRT